MSRPYRTPRDHLDDCVALVVQLIERQMVAAWEAGTLPRIRDQYSGTFVSGGEVLGQLGHAGAATPDGERQLADLDAAILAREEQIEAKLRDSRQEEQPLPFDQLRRAFGLSATEHRTLMVLIAIEVSAKLRPLMRYLVNESSRIHPDLGLLELLVYLAPETRDLMIHELAPTSRLFRYRLIEPIGTRRQQEETPLLLRPLKVNHRVIELAHGVVKLDRELAECASLIQTLAPLDTLLLPETLKSEISDLVKSALSSAAQGVATPAIILSGPTGAGRKSLLYGAARKLGCSVLRISCDRLPRDPGELARVLRALLREAILFRALPLFEGIDALSSDLEKGVDDRGRLLDRELEGYVGPIAGTCTRRDARPIGLSRGIVMVDVPLPGEQARAELWRRSIGQGRIDFDHAAARYPITGGLIVKAAESALASAHARSGDGQVTDEDLHAGVRSTLDAKLSTLGVRIAWRQDWSDLVLPPDTLTEVKEFIARIRHRRRVYEEWGFARKVAKGLGISALFAGPPGTGKTMVAGIIAHELALDLYQIDLSRVVSKYVGETEKNLAGVFDAAEAGHAILLFDEADSLFAKRTEVKSSVDRYANLEVNYLLQRMEQFNGITILTTNLDSSIDDAFRRRISFRVDFPLPDIDDRERLWRSMIPKQAQVAPNINYRALATRYEFTGGYIRNAVLRAAFLAADDDSAITTQHLQRAAMLESAAMGKLATSMGHDA
ncbi:MAG: hypothetical protein JWP01_1744 [Myxococcales bacterium]|nr:hypothetical protein [Myxococcales bacterium]